MEASALKCGIVRHALGPQLEGRKAINMTSARWHIISRRHSV